MIEDGLCYPHLFYGDNMERESGFYWHIHHRILMEWSDNIQERIDYVKKFKPEREIETRLRLMKPVKVPLPQAIVDAWKACDDARKAYSDTRKAYNDARKACDDAVHAHKAEIEALHKVECSDCPWNGHTIFP